MPGKNDINIGPDQWISWVELNLADQPLRIDALLEPTIPFWEELETLCVAGCCGIDAFSLWPKDVQRAAAAVGTEQVKSHLLELRAAVLCLDSRTIVASRLNNLFDQSVFVQLLNHLLACLGQ